MTQKDAERARIERQTAEYLAAGKTIEAVPMSVYKREKLTSDLKKYTAMRPVK